MFEFIFKPVNIKRGRKFRGFAYRLGEERSYEVAYNVTISSVKLWDPAMQRCVYVNPEFCEVATVTSEQYETDMKAYITAQIQNTVAWCRTHTASTDDTEVRQFARNVLKNNHPELEPFLAEYGLPDQRDVFTEVETTLNWAMGLKPRPYYNRLHKYCGFKPLTDEQKLHFAYSALQKKGLTQFKGFNDAWTFGLATRGLTDYAEGL